MDSTPDASTALAELQHIMVRLRSACPWDQAQTPQSLTRYAIEEAYEVEAAVQSGQPAQVCDELGDLLLQVVFQAQMYAEQGAFTLNDVIEGLCRKLIRRHPHVFSNDGEHPAASDPAAVARQWEAIKAQERAQQQLLQTRPASVLDQVKPGPALLQAVSLHKLAAGQGFDWPDHAAVFQKVNEELAELGTAVQQRDQQAISDELGDCLFALSSLAVHLQVNPEMALLGTLHRFRIRFARVEQLAYQSTQQQGKSLAELDHTLLDQLWQTAKAQIAYEQDGQPGHIAASGISSGTSPDTLSDASAAPDPSIAPDGITQP